MLRRLLQPLIAIALIVALTEWIHFRLGQPTLLSLFTGPAIEMPSRNPSPGFGPVSESEFEDYVRVLHSMHADRDLSMEAAAQQEGFSLEQFRELERRIHRDESLVERARQILRQRARQLWEERRDELSASSPTARQERAPEG